APMAPATTSARLRRGGAKSAECGEPVVLAVLECASVGPKGSLGVGCVFTATLPDEITATFPDDERSVACGPLPSAFAAAFGLARRAMRPSETREVSGANGARPTASSAIV